MAHVVTEPCRSSKYAVCTTVCPVECFRDDGDMVVILARECIDCGLCVAVCPVNAIFPDSQVPSEWNHYIELNALRAPRLPMINDLKTALKPIGT
ncbi:MAG: indolepyruvate ferredoxin oxidoreductase subunit alpha [Bdellovibrionota bacterium]